MSSVLDEVVIPAFQARGHEVLRDLNRPAVSVPGRISIGAELGAHGVPLFLIKVFVIGGAAVQVGTEVCPVPPHRRAAVAVLVAERLSQRSFVQFHLNTNALQIDMNVHLALAADPQAAVIFAFERVTAAIRDCYREVVTTAYPAHSRRRRSKVEREVADIVRRLDDESSADSAS